MSLAPLQRRGTHETTSSRSPCDKLAKLTRSSFHSDSTPGQHSQITVVGFRCLLTRPWQLKKLALEVGRVAERVLEALKPAPDAWGDFFAEAATGGLRDDLSRDLDRDRHALEHAERARQRELVTEREAYAIRDDELDHGL